MVKIKSCMDLHFGDPSQPKELGAIIDRAVAWTSISETLHNTNGPCVSCKTVAWTSISETLHNKEAAEEAKREGCMDLHFGDPSQRDGDILIYGD